MVPPVRLHGNGAPAAEAGALVVTAHATAPALAAKLKASPRQAHRRTATPGGAALRLEPCTRVGALLPIFMSAPWVAWSPRVFSTVSTERRSRRDGHNHRVHCQRGPAAMKPSSSRPLSVPMLLGWRAEVNTDSGISGMPDFMALWVV